MEDHNLYCNKCGIFIGQMKVKGFYELNAAIGTLRISGDVKAINIIDENGDKKQYCVRCATEILGYDASR